MDHYIIQIQHSITKKNCVPNNIADNKSYGDYAEIQSIAFLSLHESCFRAQMRLL